MDVYTYQTVADERRRRIMEHMRHVQVHSAPSRPTRLAIRINRFLRGFRSGPDAINQMAPAVKTWPNAYEAAGTSAHPSS